MQSKFQSHKMNFRVNFLLDCILDEIFAVYEFYFLTVRVPCFVNMTKRLSTDSWPGGPSGDTVFVRGGLP